MNREEYMLEALKLAQKGSGYTSPNPMVGAIIVKENQIVGRGFHTAYGEAHAEINALADAGEKAKGATMYVTLEPCNHTGKTPPCTHAIIKAGIKAVFIAMPDPNPGVTGGGTKFLTEKGLEVHTGILKESAEALNVAFIKFITTGLPYVIVKYAMTLDGRIATKTGDARWISNEYSRKFVHHLRNDCDAILVGIGTVKKDNPSLTTRLDEGTGVDPTRIVVDTHLDIDPSAKVLTQESKVKTILACTAEAAKKREHLFEKENVLVLPVPTKDNRIDLSELMKVIGQMKMTSVLIEGGSRILSSALKQGIVDRVNCFIAPKLLGGDGYPVCQGDAPINMDNAIQLNKTSAYLLGADVMIQGEPQFNNICD